MSLDWIQKYRQKRYENHPESQENDEFDVFYSLSEYQQKVDVDCAWSKISQRIKSESGDRYRYVLRLAACVVILLTAAFTVYQLGFKKPDHALSHFENSGSAPKIYTLPDGSSITLAKHSSISFEGVQAFAENRAVNLTGKAYFEIQKDPQHPFTISSDRGNVRVLGTSFSLDVSSGIDVYVSSGIVEVTTSSDRKKVTKGLRALTNGLGMIQIDSTVNNVNKAGWKTGHFVFEDTRLKDILPYLEDYYHVQISANVTLKNCRVTAEFRQQSLDDVLSVVASILNANIKQEGNKIKITGLGCN